MLQTRSYATKTSLSRQRGFTLIEVLVALGVGVIALLAASQFFSKQITLYVAQEQLLDMQRNARNGLDMMVREFRMAGFDPTEEAGAGITVAAATSFAFTADLNADGDLDDGDEVVLYTLFDADGDTDTDLGRRSGNVTEIVSENIQALSFLYTLTDGTETTTPADVNSVREVKISVTSRTERNDLSFSSSGGYFAKSASSVAILKNMKLRDE